MVDSLADVGFKEEDTDKLSHDEIREMMRNDIESGKRIRQLTDNERKIYANAALYACTKLPEFTNAIAILHPFVDATAETCYVDKHGRVGLSYFFLYVVSWETRVTWLIHEAMHVMNSHFARANMASMTDMTEMNICGDMEINTTLSTTRWAVLDNLVLPENFGYNKYRTMEYYHNKRQSEMEESDAGEPSEVPGAGDGQGTEENSTPNSNDSSTESDNDSSTESDNDDSAGSSGGAPKSFEEDIQDRLARDLEKGEKGPGGENSSSAQACDRATESRSSEADSEGIERSSESMQEIARQDTRARIQASLNNSRSRGRNDSNNQLLERAISLMSPPKVDWRQIFRRAVANAYAEKIVGHSETSYRRVNRRYSQGKVIFPGNVDIQPTAMIAVDTSGSMSKKDYEVTLNEIQAITEKACRTRNGVPMFSVDTSIHNVRPCRSVKELDLQGGGGTDMALAFEYVNSLPKKKQPDIFILATDGYVFWNDIEKVLSERVRYIPIILVTSAQMNTVPASMFNYAKIIPIGEENS